MALMALLIYLESALLSGSESRRRRSRTFQAIPTLCLAIIAAAAKSLTFAQLLARLQRCVRPAGRSQRCVRPCPRVATCSRDSCLRHQLVYSPVRIDASDRLTVFSGCAATVVAAVESGSRAGPAGHGCPLASCRVPWMLEASRPAAPDGHASITTSRPHWTHGHGERSSGALRGSMAS